MSNNPAEWRSRLSSIRSILNTLGAVIIRLRHAGGDPVPEWVEAELEKVSADAVRLAEAVNVAVIQQHLDATERHG